MRPRRSASRRGPRPWPAAMATARPALPGTTTPIGPCGAPRRTCSPPAVIGREGAANRERRCWEHGVVRRPWRGWAGSGRGFWAAGNGLRAERGAGLPRGGALGRGRDVPGSLCPSGLRNGPLLSFSAGSHSLFCFFQGFFSSSQLQPARSSSALPRSSPAPSDTISPPCPRAPAPHPPGAASRSARGRAGTSTSPTTASASGRTAGSSASARRAAWPSSCGAC